MRKRSDEEIEQARGQRAAALRATPEPSPAEPAPFEDGAEEGRLDLAGSPDESGEVKEKPAAEDTAPRTVGDRAEVHVPGETPHGVGATEEIDIQDRKISPVEEVIASGTSQVSDHQASVDALLAASASGGEEDSMPPPRESVSQDEEPIEEGPSQETPDDIGAMLGDETGRHKETTVERVLAEQELHLESAAGDQSGERDVQEDIDALFEAAPEDGGETDALGAQADIDTLLAANTPGGEEVSTADESVEEVELVDTQANIDALLAANKPDDGQAVPADENVDEAAPPSDQEDIDTLLAESLPESEDVDAGTVTTDDEAAGEPEPVVDAEGGGESVAVEVDESFPPEETDIISQDDIDALLVSGDDEEEAEQEAAEPVAVEEDTGQDELDMLLQSDEDALGDNLFEEGAAEEAPGESGETAQEEILSEDPGLEEEETEEGDDMVLGIPSSTPPETGPEEDLLDEPLLPEEVIEKTSFIARLLSLIRIPVGMIGGALSRLGLPSLKGRPSKLAVVIVGSAGALLLALVGGGYWFFFGGPSLESGVADMQTKETAPETKPDSGAALKDAVLIDDSLVAAEHGTGEANAVNIGIYLPVEFDTEISRVMRVDVNLVFETTEWRNAAMERAFFSTVSVENAIDSFFRDKFYEETVFVQDKLEEYLNQNLAKTDQLAGLKTVRLSGLSFQE